MTSQSPPAEKNLKQIICVRRDLKMPVGKLAAQVAHASMMFISESLRFKLSIPHPSNPKMWVPAVITEEEQQWLQGLFTKVVLGVASEDELLEIHYLAVLEGLTSHIVQDAGLTVFKEPTYTTVALGPHEHSRINKITGHLKLL